MYTFGVYDNILVIQTSCFSMFLKAISLTVNHFMKEYKF